VAAVPARRSVGTVPANSSPPSTAAVLAASGVGFGVWFYSRSPREYTFAGLTCTETQQLAPAFARDELPAETHEKVREHVHQCPRCGPLFEEMGIKV